MERKIEVAFFKSTFFDAAGAGDKVGKGNTPKEEMPVGQVLGIRLRAV